MNVENYLSTRDCSREGKNGLQVQEREDGKKPENVKKGEDARSRHCARDRTNYRCE